MKILHLLIVALFSIILAKTSYQANVPSSISDNEFAEFEVSDEPSNSVSDNIQRPQNGVNEVPMPKTEIPEEEKRPPAQAEEEFSFLADEEEFEDYQKIEAEEIVGQKDTPQNANKPPKPLTFAEVPSHFRSNWSSYQVEIIALVIILLYALNYLHGKSKNHSIAYQWFADNRERLEKQFALVGDDGTSQENEGGCLIRETDFIYSVWCTGRVGCRGMHTQIKLCKRQDLLGIAIGLIRPRPDRVIHKIDLDPNEMDSFMIIFGQRKSVLKAVKEMHDLAAYVTERKNLDKIQLPPNFCVFAEMAETTSAIIDNATLQFLKKCEKYLEYIHISDQYSGVKLQDEQYVRLPETHPTLIFSYFLSESSEEIEELLLNFAFFMVDKVRRYRLSKEGKAKADKKRQSVQENFLKLTHQQRQEAAQTRREEKTRERKQRVMEEEDPNRQKRLEKLEQKRDAKLKAPKMKQFKIK